MVTALCLFLWGQLGVESLSIVGLPWTLQDLSLHSLDDSSSHSTICDDQKRLQTLPNAPDGKTAVTENHRLRTRARERLPVRSHKGGRRRGS